MKFKIVLFNIILFLSCNSEESVELNLLDYVPQNTIATFQINDSKMVENAIENNASTRIMLNNMGRPKCAAQNEQVDDQHLGLDNNEFNIHQNV